ncbi:MAG: PilZ domain-containing protein [Chloroflexi bacterium]|nr:PilZ domain-containing protein [Chloroflexota bacterium]
MEQLKTLRDFIRTEKRTKPRIKCSYPAIIQSLDDQDHNFDARARVINLSSSGIFLITKWGIRNNNEIHVKIALSTGALELDNPSRLAVKGTVLRNEPQPDGSIGLAIKFHGYKFI